MKDCFLSFVFSDSNSQLQNRTNSVLEENKSLREEVSILAYVI